jgi:hypothetical protein
LQKLNLPEYTFRFKQEENKTYIFDIFRKKYIVLTPEEWVRQNFLMHLVTDLDFPKSLIAVEAGLKLYKTQKRTDIVVYDKQGIPILIVECKAPEIAINEKVFDQIVRYNMALQVNYLVVTNGLNHYCCKLDYTKKSYKFLKSIPNYTDILT